MILLDFKNLAACYSFEEGHEFVLVQVRFGNVFDVYCAFLLSVVVFLIWLVLVAVVCVLAVLRALAAWLVVVALGVVVLLLVVGFLHDWGWWNPGSAGLGG